MSVSKSKVWFGMVVSVVGIGVAVPVAFWFVSEALNRALGFAPVLPQSLSLILAGASILIGVFWMTWAYSYLHFVGKGLPIEAFGRAFHPTQVMVTTGPYAYTRNPMVLGLLFVFLGLAFWQRSLAGFVLVPVIAAAVSVYLVVFEEKALRERFGEDYEKYQRSVPLLLPRLGAYVHQPAAYEGDMR